MTIDRNSRWFRTSPQRDALNIICLPFAAGDATIYASFGRQLGTRAAIHPVDLPGRGNRFNDALITDMEQLVDELIDALIRFFGFRYVILGTSMGAWVGLHACQRLSARGLPLPEALVVCAASAPASIRSLPKLSRLPDNRALEVLLEFNPRLSRLLTHSELVELFLPVLRADFLLCENWTPALDQALPIPVIAFAGADDHIADVASMKNWSRMTSNRFSLSCIPGDHFFIENPPAELIDALLLSLDLLTSENVGGTF